MSTLIKNTDRQTLHYLENLVARKYGIYPTELHSPARDNRVAHARFMVWYLLKWYRHWSSKKIAVAFERDHTTILNGLRQAKVLGLDTEAEWLYATANI